MVARIKEAIEVYGLTARDLGFTTSQRSASPGRKRISEAARKRSGTSVGKREAPVRYRDDVGNTWGGRGPRPRWLRNALASGKTLQDLEA